MAGSPPAGESRPVFLVTALKVIAVTTLISTIALHWVSAGGLDQSNLGRLAVAVTGYRADPAVTGSIPDPADAPRLDPCVLALKH